MAFVSTVIARRVDVAVTNRRGVFDTRSVGAPQNIAGDIHIFIRKQRQCRAQVPTSQPTQWQGPRSARERCLLAVAFVRNVVAAAEIFRATVI